MVQTNDVRTLIDAMGVTDSQEIITIRRRYQRMMMEYQCAIMEVETKLNVLNREFAVAYNHNPIQSIKTRLKKADSIIDKLKRKGLDYTLESIEANITDIAGVRVICSFPGDIYTMADLLLHQDDIKMVEIKDYIKKPKESGYRSLHLIVEVPIFLSEGKKMKVVEVQYRTIAMDFWASVEHQLKYKRNLENTDEITKELRDCADVITNVDYRMQQIRGEIEYIDDDKVGEPSGDVTETEAEDERIFKTYEDDDRFMGTSHDYLRSLARHRSG